MGARNPPPAISGGGPPGPPGPGPAAPPPPAAEPLHDFADIGAAVNAIAGDTPDTAPMINMFKDMSARLHSLSLEQRATKRENAMLVAASRKAKVAATLSDLPTQCRKLDKSKTSTFSRGGAGRGG